MGGTEGGPGSLLSFNASTCYGHGIGLTWTASITPSVTYNVYRSSVSGGPCTKIANGVTGLGYTDAPLPALTTYYDVVTAASGGGGKSLFHSSVGNDFRTLI